MKLPPPIVSYRCGMHRRGAPLLAGVFAVDGRPVFARRARNAWIEPPENEAAEVDGWAGARELVPPSERRLETIKGGFFGQMGSVWIAPDAAPGLEPTCRSHGVWTLTVGEAYADWESARSAKPITRVFTRDGSETFLQRAGRDPRIFQRFGTSAGHGWWPKS